MLANTGLFVHRLFLMHFVSQCHSNDFGGFCLLPEGKALLEWPEDLNLSAEKCSLSLFLYWKLARELT